MKSFDIYSHILLLLTSKRSHLYVGSSMTEQHHGFFRASLSGSARKTLKSTPTSLISMSAMTFLTLYKTSGDRRFCPPQDARDDFVDSGWHSTSRTSTTIWIFLDFSPST